MSIDNDSSDYEARRLEQRRQLEKQQLKAQQDRDPLRSFEAKLSTQALKEEASRESLKKTDRELKEMLAEKGDFLKKVLGEKDVNSAADLAARAQKHEQEFLKQKEAQRRSLGNTVEEKIEERKKTQDKHDAENEETQKAVDAHERIVEIEDSNKNDSGQGFAEGDHSEDSSEREFGSSSGNSTFSDSNQAKILDVKSVSNGQDFGGNTKGGFSFSDEELDRIVAAVEHRSLANGEEAFAVQLNNDFFDGLKIEATRTAQGVVLTFWCPNALVRSQMSRQKNAILARFSEKQIRVHEVRFQ